MGNPFTCSWEVAHLIILEHLMLESKFEKNLKFMVRFVVGVFVIWEKAQNKPNDWKDFKSYASQASTFNWVCECLEK